MEVEDGTREANTLDDLQLMWPRSMQRDEGNARPTRKLAIPKELQLGEDSSQIDLSLFGRHHAGEEEEEERMTPNLSPSLLKVLLPKPPPLAVIHHAGGSKEEEGELHTPFAGKGSKHTDNMSPNHDITP